MKAGSEARVLREVCNKIAKVGKITDEQFSKLSEVFGARFEKAWRVVREGRVKKYIFKPSGRVVWIVVGKGRDYLVMPRADFCSCEDFYFQFDKGHLCYHIIAQKLAEATGSFDLIVEEDSFYDIFLEEWKAVGEKFSKGIKG